MKTKINKKAVILVSGGMDSAVLIDIAKKENDELYFLHLNYKNKTYQKEIDCFNKLATHHHIPKDHQKVIDLSFLNEIGGSSLTDQKIEVSKMLQNDFIPSSYVPFRNSIILSLATSWAEVIGAQEIFIGANEEDSPGYPDCRKQYIDCFNELIKLGTSKVNIKIMTPIIDMTKAEIVKQGLELNTPFINTWSCYSRIDKACGECDSCVLRKKGFLETNSIDPIEYL